MDKGIFEAEFMDLRKSGITQSSLCRSLVLQEKETRNLCRGTLEICLKVKNSIVFSALKVVIVKGSQNCSLHFSRPISVHVLSWIDDVMVLTQLFRVPWNLFDRSVNR